MAKFKKTKNLNVLFIYNEILTFVVKLKKNFFFTYGYVTW